jgi:hypothetical protein
MVRTPKKKLLCTKEIATLSSLSVSFFEKHRNDGIGPRYLKIGGRVFYEVDDFEFWLNCHQRDPGGFSYD